MISFPPCKINLGLNVIAKRADGYHDIETCFYPVPWTDILEIIPSDVLAFTSSGLSIPGNAADNLCVKAYHLLQKEFNLNPVKIHLHKLLPTGAGLGGGSSDAAHTLRLLNTVFDLNLKDQELMSYASALGSDCSFFINHGPMLGTGRGEVLKSIEVSLKGKYIVLVNPALHVSTAEAYAGIRPSLHAKRVEEIVTRIPLNKWRHELINDFEDSVFKRFPVIPQIKETLYQHGAAYACMSGSGSTVFGIFNSPVDLRESFPTYMYWGGNLLG